MDYILLHDLFIEKFKKQDISDYQGVVESHHIVPRHDSGTDEENNLVNLTYRQHKFIHKLRYFAYKQRGDFVAYKFMYGLKEEALKGFRSYAGSIGGKVNTDSGHMKHLSETYGSANGKRNVESGLLERIRPLANTKEQRLKVSELGVRNQQSGFLLKIAAMGWEKNRGVPLSSERKEQMSIAAKIRVGNDKQLYDKLKQNLSHGAAKKIELSNKLWANVLDNCEHNELYLNKKSNKSKYKVISPDGVVFDSVTFAAKYYSSSIQTSVFENWVKREHHGWSRVLKRDTE